MKVIVKTFDSKYIQLDAESSHTIVSLKQQIQDKELIPCDKQELILGLKQLENERTLAEYNFQEETILKLIQKP